MMMMMMMFSSPTCPPTVVRRALFLARMSVGDVHDKLSCTRLQNYTIGASLKSESLSVSVPWNLSLTEHLQDNRSVLFTERDAMKFSMKLIKFSDNFFAKFSCMQNFVKFYITTHIIVVTNITRVRRRSFGRTRW